MEATSNARYHLKIALELLNESEFWEHITKIKNHLQQVQQALDKKHARKSLVIDNEKIEMIKHAVADFMKIDYANYENKRCFDSIVTMKYTAIYFCRDIMHYTVMELGEQFQFSHPTISHATKKIKGRILSDTTFAAQIDALRKIITNKLFK